MFYVIHGFGLFQLNISSCLELNSQTAICSARLRWVSITELVQTEVENSCFRSMSDADTTWCRGGFCCNFGVRSRYDSHRRTERRPRPMLNVPLRRARTIISVGSKTKLLINTRTIGARPRIYRILPDYKTKVSALEWLEIIMCKKNNTRFGLIVREIGSWWSFSKDRNHVSLIKYHLT